MLQPQWHLICVPYLAVTTSRRWMDYRTVVYVVDGPATLNVGRGLHRLRDTCDRVRVTWSTCTVAVGGSVARVVL